MAQGPAYAAQLFGVGNTFECKNGKLTIKNGKGNLVGHFDIGGVLADGSIGEETAKALVDPSKLCEPDRLILQGK